MHSVVHRSTHEEPDFLSLELMAICAVGKALELLEDPEARLRVLRWANERYQQASTTLSAVVASAVVAPAPVPAVPVLRLAAEAPALHLALAPEVDLEPEREPQIGLALDLELEPAAQSEPEPDMAVDSLKDLFDLEAPDGLSLAPIVQVGAMLGETEDLSDLYEPPSDNVEEQPMDLYEVPAEPARPQLHLVSREEQPFEQLIDDFVENLRRLTRECVDV